MCCITDYCTKWCLCDCMYKFRKIFNVIVILSMLLDLCLTVYIAIQLLSPESQAFACCASSIGTSTDPNGGSVCQYDNIGSASDIAVDSNGYCVKENNGIDYSCNGTLATCASGKGISMDNLCSEKILDEVATYNYDLFVGMLTVKIIGICFVLFCEFYDRIKSKKSNEVARTNSTDYDMDSNGNMTANQSDSSSCCVSKSRECTVKCLWSSFICLLKVGFLIFGTVTTCLAIIFLNLTDHVSYGFCSSIDDSALASQCRTIIKDCTIDGSTSFYNVVFSNLNLTAPTTIDLISTIVSLFVWFLRIGAIRNAVQIKKHLRPV